MPYKKGFFAYLVVEFSEMPYKKSFQAYLVELLTVTAGHPVVTTHPVVITPSDHIKNLISHLKTTKFTPFDLCNVTKY